MAHEAEIPYGAYWSTPFARWQGAYAHLNSLEFAARVVRAELAARGIPGEAFDHGVLGISVPQKHSFYGLPWLAGMAGLAHLSGPTVMQACATGARVLLAAVQEVDAGLSQASIAITCDRTSNGPHIYYPNPRGPGGTGAHEDWVMDNFGCDPLWSAFHASNGAECCRQIPNIGLRPARGCAAAGSPVSRRRSPTTCPFLRRFNAAAL